MNRLLALFLAAAIGLSLAPAGFAAQKKSVKKTAPAPAEEPAEVFPAIESTSVPVIGAASAIVVDAQSGKVLFEHNSEQERQVASTQKLLTALLVAESGNLDGDVVVEASDTWAEPSKLNIKAGETYRRGDLLRVLLVKSMNDVARCLARDNGGSLEGFAAKMNAKAAQLGMASSHFENPNGLPIPGQYSCARDMSRLAMAAYRNRAIRNIVCLKEITWRSPSGKTTVFHNTNKVLRGYALCNGMKTGYTEAAGHCLVSSAASGGHEVISVVLGDNQSIWNDSYRLLAWALSGEGVAAN